LDKRRVRRLLAVRNGKMGAFIAHFDLPAIATCPGRSSICERLCYASHGRFVTRVVRRRLAWCYRQSLRTDFVPRLVREIRRRGVIVCRVHVSGDFYDSDYAWKWLEVIQACPSVRFYWYSRSWRVAAIAPALEEMARLANVRGWYSCDAETGEPDIVPEGVRLCYLQQAPEARPAKSELVFRARPMRRQPRLGLPMICPQETNKDVTCGSCQFCWR
jgi:hypothetical protein